MKQASGYMSYYDRIEPLRNLSDEDYGKIRRATDDYAEYGIIPELPPHLAPFFLIWKPSIDAGKISYAETCAKRKYNIAVDRYKKTDENKPEFWYWWAHDESYDANLFKKEHWYDLATNEYKSIQMNTSATNNNRTITEHENEHEHEHEHEHKTKQPSNRKYNRAVNGYSQHDEIGDISHMIIDMEDE